MGILGQYLMVDEATLDYLVELNGEDLAAALKELSEDKAARVYHLEKLWDGLHFLLTGATAAYPVEDDKLSEAVVGVHVFNDEDEDAEFVGCIQTEELCGIVQAMKSVDLEGLWDSFNLEEFRRQKVYPKIWVDEDKQQLFQELVTEFKNLLSFYEKAMEDKMHIVITVH